MQEKAILGCKKRRERTLEHGTVKSRVMDIAKARYRSDQG